MSDIILVHEDDEKLEAHKVILAASSPFLQNLLRSNAHTHPLIFMRGVDFDNLQAIVNFLYCGEASVHQENLEAFLQVAEEFQMTGFMDLDNTEEPEIKEENLTLNDAVEEERR